MEGRRKVKKQGGETEKEKKVQESEPTLLRI